MLLILRGVTFLLIWDRGRHLNRDKDQILMTLTDQTEDTLELIETGRGIQGELIETGTGIQGELIGTGIPGELIRTGTYTPHLPHDQTTTSQHRPQ